MSAVIAAILAEIQVVHDLANPPASGDVIKAVNTALDALARILALAQDEQAKIEALT